MFAAKSLVAIVALVAGAAAQYPPNWNSSRGVPVLANAPYPNTTIAGVTVIDTPIIRYAIEAARNHSTDAVFKHQMRAWLFGSLIINANPDYYNSVDIEIQGVAAILHDLGWDMSPDSPITTHNHRFEVDGAIAARKFIAAYGDDNWDSRRTQLLWDSIALHTSRNIGYFKEWEVATTSMGISVEYDGLIQGVTNETFQEIIRVFPNSDLLKATNDTFTWFAATKPQVTYGKTRSRQRMRNSADHSNRQLYSDMGRTLRPRLCSQTQN